MAVETSTSGSGGKPQKAQTAYEYFSSEMQTEMNRNDSVKGLTSAEKSKLIEQQWGNLQDQNKTFYENLAKKDQLRYQKEVENLKKAKELSRPKTGKSVLSSRSKSA